MHDLPIRVRRSWAKIQSQNGRFCSVVKICTFLNNYTIFEETNCIAILRTNCPTKVQSLSEIENAVFQICMINADIRSLRPRDNIQIIDSFSLISSKDRDVRSRSYLTEGECCASMLDRTTHVNTSGLNTATPQKILTNTASPQEKSTKHRHHRTP